MRTRADVVIVGAGLAGAATAWRLSRQGVRDIVIVEREPAPGAHASGKNAGLVRRLLDDPALIAPALAGAEFLAAPAPEVSARPLARQTGSLILCGAERAHALAPVAARVGAERIAPASAARLAPLLAGGRFEAAFSTAQDGVADIRGLLEGFLRAATESGAELTTACEALSLELRGGRVAALRTSRGTIETRAVLDAAGPWAGALARGAGVEPPPMRAFRRHLFVARAPGAAAREAAWAWDIDRGFYFRAEGAEGYYLLSACDEEPHPPRPPDVDPAAARALAERAAAVAPALAAAPVARAWACLRTFAPDGRFVVGETPALPGLFYAAALGGHGVTTAAALGALAADGILSPDRVPSPFRAARA